MTRLPSERWSIRIEAGYAGIDAELAALKVREESWPQDFVRLAQIRLEMAALRVETAGPRMLRKLELAKLRAGIAVVRTLLWPRWPG